MAPAYFDEIGVVVPVFALVDDHRLVLDGYQSQLQAHYPDSRFEYTGSQVDQAVAAIAASTVDCVLLDLDLGDGSTSASNIERLVGTDTPVIIVSAMIDRALVSKGLAIGVVGFVSKQAPFDELVQAIDAAMRGEQYMSPDIAQAIISSPTIAISEQERIAVTLYASGMKMSSVARRMGVSDSTVNEYIKRVRAKYARAGNPLPTKVHLYQAAREEGWLD